MLSKQRLNLDLRHRDICVERGELVSDRLIMDIMEARLQEPDCAKGYLLDGFPRTIPQAEELQETSRNLI